MQANDIIAILESNMRHRAQKQPPVWHDGAGTLCIRASSAGSCIRRLWYYAQGETPLPDSIESIHATDAGNRAHENLYEALGDIVEGRDAEVQYRTPDFNLIGHIDGILADRVVREPGYYDRLPENLETVLVEFKSAKQYGFNKVVEEGLDDMYRAQIHVYMASLGAKRAIVIFDNKPDKTVPAIVSHLGKCVDDASGVLAALDIDFDGAFFAALLERLKAVGGVPAPPQLPHDDVIEGIRCFPWQCTFCCFAHVCRPDAKLYKRWGKAPLKPGYTKGQKEGIRLGEPV